MNVHSLSPSDVVRDAAAIAFVLVAAVPLARHPIGPRSLVDVGAVFLLAHLASSLLVGRPLRAIDFLLSAVASVFLYVRHESRARAAHSGKPEAVRPEQ